MDVDQGKHGNNPMPEDKRFQATDRISEDLNELGQDQRSQMNRYWTWQGL
jgi:hypothetical protein